MNATLVAKDLAAGHGAHPLFSGLDLVVAPGDVIGLVGANGAGKSTLLRSWPAGSPPRTAPSSSARPTPPSATCRRSPTGAPARPYGSSWPAVPASPTPSTRSTTATHALGEGRPGADDGYAQRAGTLARPRRRRPGRAGRSRSPPTSGLASDLDHADDRAVRRPGRPRRPGVAAAQPLRHLPARRADQRPRPGRAATGWRTSSAGCGPARSWSATTASSSPVPSPGSSSSTSPSSRSTTSAAATRPTWRSARSPGGTPARSTTSTPTLEPASRRAPGPSAPGWRRASRTPAARRATTTRSAATFRAEATEKQAAKARQTERLIERLDVVEEPRKEWELRMEIAAAPARRRGRRHPARRGGAPRRLHARPGRPADRLGRPGRDHRRQRLRQVHPARRAARPDPARRGPRDARLRASSSARSTRRAGCSSATSRCVDAFSAAVPGLVPAEVRTLLAKFGLRAAHVLRPAPPSRRASAPGPRSRCCRPAASTCSSSTSRPTTSTCPRSSSSSRRWTTYTGTLLLVTHDRRMLEAITLTRLVEVSNGQIS